MCLHTCAVYKQVHIALGNLLHLQAICACNDTIQQLTYTNSYLMGCTHSTTWCHGSSISDDVPDELCTAVQDLLVAESLAQDSGSPEYQKLWAETIVGARTGLVSKVTLQHAHQVVHPDSWVRICQLLVDGQLMDLIYPCQDCHMDWDSCPNPAGTGTVAEPCMDCMLYCVYPCTRFSGKVCSKRGKCTMSCMLIAVVVFHQDSQVRVCEASAMGDQMDELNRLGCLAKQSWEGVESHVEQWTTGRLPLEDMQDPLNGKLEKGLLTHLHSKPQVEKA